MLKIQVKLPGWGIFLVFGSILFILFPIVAGGRLASAMNEAEADNKRNQFLEELETLVRSSSSYEEFAAKYARQFSTYH